MKEYLNYILKYCVFTLKNFIDVLKNHYIYFKGTATRSQFWCFIAAIFICFLVLKMVAGFLALLLLLGTMVPCIAITVRRMRNAGIDYRLGFIPVLFYIFAIVNMVSPKVLMVILNLVNFVALIALIIFCVLPSK